MEHKLGPMPPDFILVSIQSPTSQAISTSLMFLSKCWVTGRPLQQTLKQFQHLLTVDNGSFFVVVPTDLSRPEMEASPLTAPDFFFPLDSLMPLTHRPILPVEAHNWKGHR